MLLQGDPSFKKTLIRLLNHKSVHEPPFPSCSCYSAPQSMGQSFKIRFFQESFVFMLCFSFTVLISNFKSEGNTERHSLFTVWNLS